MNNLKYIYLAIVHLIKQVWFFPQTVANSFKQRRLEEVVRNEHESDRLDRLRNPSKYQGK
jgi:hypothetical protein